MPERLPPLLVQRKSLLFELNVILGHNTWFFFAFSVRVHPTHEKSVLMPPHAEYVQKSRRKHFIENNIWDIMLHGQKCLKY